MKKKKKIETNRERGSSLCLETQAEGIDNIQKAGGHIQTPTENKNQDFSFIGC